MSNIKISQIVAFDDEGGIGIGNKLPWRIPSDLKMFKQKTDGHPVIMGRKTYESIGGPLPNREMIVISRQDIQIDGCKVVKTIDDAIAAALDYADSYDLEEIFIIGGSEIYQATATITDTVYATLVRGQHGCDHHYKLPENMFAVNTSDLMEENGERFIFITYQRGDNG